jgi:hypothetical protein
VHSPQVLDEGGVVHLMQDVVVVRLGLNKRMSRRLKYVTDD